MNEPVAVAILAKAPLPGFAKTRLIPVLGAEGAALLQARLVERAVATACAARLGPVTLWAAPDESHALFQAIGARFGIALARQDNGDLGARMLAASGAKTLRWVPKGGVVTMDFSPYRLTVLLDGSNRVERANCG